MRYSHSAQKCENNGRKALELSSFKIKNKKFVEGNVMNIKSTQVVISFLLVILALVLLNTTSRADDASNQIGYVKDSAGNVIRSGGSKNCIRSGSWSPDNQFIEGCGGVVLAITAPGFVMFAFDSADLTPEGKAVIDKHRGNLQPKLASGYKGMVIGYTDSSGDPDYNIDLSQRRAETVRVYLLGSEVKNEKITVVGRGAKFPAASNDTREGRAINRRVEVIFVDEKSAAK
jgi:outer membrane protein OmpA-like peptidoglycan-associated protein